MATTHVHTQTAEEFETEVLQTLTNAITVTVNRSEGITTEILFRMYVFVKENYIQYILDQLVLSQKITCENGVYYP